MWNIELFFHWFITFLILTALLELFFFTEKEKAEAYAINISLQRALYLSVLSDHQEKMGKTLSIFDEENIPYSFTCNLCYRACIARPNIKVCA